MNYRDGIELINKAYEKQIDEKLYLRWIAKYDHISFDDFKAQMTSTAVAETKTEEEILEDVSDILKEFKWGDE